MRPIIYDCQQQRQEKQQWSEWTIAKSVCALVAHIFANMTVQWKKSVTGHRIIKRWWPPVNQSKENKKMFFLWFCSGSLHWFNNLLLVAICYCLPNANFNCLTYARAEICVCWRWYWFCFKRKKQSDLSSLDRFSLGFSIVVAGVVLLFFLFHTTCQQANILPDFFLTGICILNHLLQHTYFILSSQAKQLPSPTVHRLASPFLSNVLTLNSKPIELLSSARLIFNLLGSVFLLCSFFLFATSFLCFPGFLLLYLLN